MLFQLLHPFTLSLSKGLNGIYHIVIASFPEGKAKQSFSNRPYDEIIITGRDCFVRLRRPRNDSFFLAVMDRQASFESRRTGSTNVLIY